MEPNARECTYVSTDMHVCLGQKNGVYQGLFNDKLLPTWHSLMIHP